PGVRELVTPYVLSSPPSHERLAIEAAIDTAIEHLPRILDGDLESVMNHLHRRAPEAPAAD
ncbi:MAG: hypothetical protein LC647_06985, partial [Beggiatoa sp.]|nr:hypothetical protein [Beggiatoa sp.]